MQMFKRNVTELEAWRAECEERGKDKNESKALSLPDWNPQQEAGNFSVFLEIMPQADVKGIG